MTILPRTPQVDIVAFSVGDTVALASCVWSVGRAARRIEEKGWRARLMMMLRPGQERAEDWVRHRLPATWDVVELASIELGAARREALRATSAAQVALIDGTDMWCEHWLETALLDAPDESAVRRPEILLGFEHDHFTSQAYDLHVQRGDLGTNAMLAVHHYRSGFIASREVLAAVPYPSADEARGWEAVDWWWNCNVAGAGFRHRIVPATFHYRRLNLDRLGARPVPSGGSQRMGPTSLAEGMEADDRV